VRENLEDKEELSGTSVSLACHGQTSWVL
jgi:hypothetical protein